MPDTPSSTVASGPPDHRNNLDVVRLALAVAVVFSHSYPLCQGTSNYEPLDRITRHGFDVGKAAVVGFFVISGLLVAQSWERTGSLVRFLEKRSLRILPGYTVAAAVCILAVLPAVGWGTPAFRQLAAGAVSVDALRADHLLAANPFPDVLNGSLWTIRYEFYCYLILAALGLAGVLARPATCLWAAAASLLLVVADRFAARLPVPVDVPGVGTLQAWARFLPAFMAGVLLFHFRRRLPVRGWALAVAVVAVAAMFRYRLTVPAEMAVPFVAAAAVSYVGFHPRLRLHHFGRYGDFSYGTYLYAWAVQQGVVRLVPGLRPAALFAVAAPLAVAAGVLSWHAVERPALRLKPRDALRRLGGRFAGPPAAG